MDNAKCNFRAKLPARPVAQARCWLPTSEPSRAFGAGSFSPATSQLVERGLSAAHARCDCACAHLRAVRAEAALEGISAAIFVLDADARVVHMNRTAKAFGGLGDGIFLHCNKIVATQASKRLKLQTLISSALAATYTNLAQAAGAVALERNSGRPPLLVRVLPLLLDWSTKDASTGHAIVLVTDPELAANQPAGILKTLFSFSPTEIAVAESLRAGLRLAEIADLRSVSIETIRTQVKSLMLKTETRRQSDLVLLLTTVVTIPIVGK